MGAIVACYVLRCWAVESYHSRVLQLFLLDYNDVHNNAWLRVFVRAEPLPTLRMRVTLFARFVPYPSAWTGMSRRVLARGRWWRQLRTRTQKPQSPALVLYRIIRRPLSWSKCAFECDNWFVFALCKIFPPEVVRFPAIIAIFLYMFIFPRAFWYFLMPLELYSSSWVGVTKRFFHFCEMNWALMSN